MHDMKPFVQQPLTWHDYCSRGNDMFGWAGVDVIVHPPYLSNCQPEKNTRYGPSYLTYFSGNPGFGFFLEKSYQDAC